LSQNGRHDIADLPCVHRPVLESATATASMRGDHPSTRSSVFAHIHALNGGNCLSLTK
jgi:hypothetical protein